MHQVRRFHHTLFAFGFHLGGADRKVGIFLLDGVESDGGVNSLHCGVGARNGDDSALGNLVIQCRSDVIFWFESDVASFENGLHRGEIGAKDELGLTINDDLHKTGVLIQPTAAIANILTHGGTRNATGCGVGSDLLSGSSLERVLLRRENSAANHECQSTCGCDEKRDLLAAHALFRLSLVQTMIRHVFPVIDNILWGRLSAHVAESSRMLEMASQCHPLRQLPC